MTGALFFFWGGGGPQGDGCWGGRILPVLAKYIEKLTLFKDNNLVNNSLQKIDEKFLLENGF